MSGPDLPRSNGRDLPRSKGRDLARSKGCDLARSKGRDLPRSKGCDLPLVLASASPQRKAILEKLNVDFTVRAVAVDELERGEPKAVALANALAKAKAACRPGADEVVLGVDTVVDLDGRLYGKPANEREAFETLTALSGERHFVHSGVAIVLAGSEHTALATTAVQFRRLDEHAIERYLELGEWRGRAGGYAIQGAGAALVRAIEGDYENVVGLPVATLLDMRQALSASHCH